MVKGRPRNRPPQRAVRPARAAAPEGVAADLAVPAAAQSPGGVRGVAGLLRPADWSLLGMMLAIKAITLIMGVVSFELIQNERVKWPRGVLEIWNRWDAPHYLDLAQYGYESTGERAYWLVFYPLFPWLTRLAAFPFGDYLVGAFIVSTIASLAAGLLLYRLVALDFEDGLARRAVWFLFIYPFAYLLHVGYTESLFIALVLGTFLAARRDQWLLAGVLGALACLARVNGLVLLPCLALEIGLRFWQTRRIDWRWLAIGLVPLGFGAYLLLNYRVTGDPFAFSKLLEEKWYKALGSPIKGVGDIWKGLAWRSPAERQMVVLHQLVFLAIGAIGAVVAWFKLRPSYGLWIAANLVLMTSTTFILSVPRYTMIFFPLPIIFALLARRPQWANILIVSSLLLQSIYLALFVLGRGGY